MTQDDKFGWFQTSVNAPSAAAAQTGSKDPDLIIYIIFDIPNVME